MVFVKTMNARSVAVMELFWILAGIKKAGNGSELIKDTYLSL